MGLIKIIENLSRKINIQSTRHIRDSRTWFIETEQHTLEKNIPNHFLEQRVSDRAGGTPENNIQNANQEHPQRVQTKSHPETEETLVKEI